jgi:NADH:ubiquinone oxidoreductase subunit 3 (subunit A)
MGDFEIFITTLSTLILSFVIYNLLTSFTFRDLLRRFGYLKTARRDFYECGFRPITQKPIHLPIQFLLICIFFLLYDIELIFIFPYVSGITFSGLHDFLLIVIFLFLFLLSLLVDLNRHVLLWQF